MTLAVEDLNQSASEYQGGLPESLAVANDILARAEPLRSDPACWQEFYGVMGIVPVEPQVGEPLSGSSVLLWDESVQPSGSYKSCGASYALMRTDPSETIWTYSTGNHGTSVGIAAARRGQAAYVAVPQGISPAKEQRLYDTGAVIVKRNPVTGDPHVLFSDAERTAKELDGQPGATVIDPFGHPDVLAGQCKVGWEMVQALVARGLADEHVIIPVAMAGGGHITGVALPIWQAKQEGVLGPGIQVVGVQPEGADAMNRALARLEEGEPYDRLFGAQGPDKDCDALAIDGDSLSPLTMAIVSDPQFVQGIFTVGKVSTGQSMIALQRQLNKAVEPAAALPHAFARELAANLAEPTIFMLPVSGCNVSPATSLLYEQTARRDQFARMSRAHLLRDVHGLEEIYARGPNPGITRRGNRTVYAPSKG